MVSTDTGTSESVAGAPDPGATRKRRDEIASGTTREVTPAATARTRRLRPHLGSVAVLVIGLVITATMAIGARGLRNDNEDRLLRERVREVAAVASAAIPNVQFPLASAGLVADETGGSVSNFREVLRPEMGERFASAALFPIAAGATDPAVRIGTPLKLGSLPEGRRQAFLREAADRPTLSLLEMLDGPNRRLGYAIPSPDKRYLAYAEAQLPRARRARIAGNSAFADLDYALYVGKKRDPAKLIGSSTGGKVPLTGRIAQGAVPFGDSNLLIVLQPKADLGGEFLARLPWYLLAAGVVLTLAAAVLVEFLIRRREQAERLAGELRQIAAENARLLADQRTVAYTLQHSLLPEELPDMDGLELGVRYAAGVEGVEVGGDWYDLIRLDEGRLFFVVGDVSGRGLRAATVMASLRYAIRAYATDGDDPATVLTKLSKLLSVSRDGNFATVLCGIIDVAKREVTIASAGHPYPLLLTNGHADYVTLSNGVPVGVVGTDAYHPVIVSVPARATLLVYTDGLVERRGEELDAGFERLRNACASRDSSLEELLTAVVSEVTLLESEDDTALLGIRWTA